MRYADIIYDIGPGAGVHGGYVTASGTSKELEANPESLTGQYLSGKASIPIPKSRTPHQDQWLEVIGARCHNLKNIHVKIPIGLITCIGGVSGSGKSTLINDTLFPSVHNTLLKSNWPVGECSVGC